MRIRWTPAAVADLTHISNYLRRAQPRLQADTIRKLYASSRSLKQWPNRGRPGLRHGTRELIVRGLPYIIIYRVKDEHVEILRIYHVAQERT